MKTFIKFSLSGVLIFILLTVMYVPSLAQVDLKRPKLPKATEKVKRDARIDLVTKADLSVLAIRGGRCPSSVSGIDAFYIDGIIVDVGLNDIMVAGEVKNEPSTVVGYLTVKYFDLIEGREKTQTLMMERSKFPTPGRFTVVNTTLLVKKSYGIRAEVKLNSPGYAKVDPNAGNNSLVINECNVLID